MLFRMENVKLSLNCPLKGKHQLEEGEQWGILFLEPIFLLFSLFYLGTRNRQAWLKQS